VVDSDQALISHLFITVIPVRYGYVITAKINTMNEPIIQAMRQMLRAHPPAKLWTYEQLLQKLNQYEEGVVRYGILSLLETQELTSHTKENSQEVYQLNGRKAHPWRKPAK
jgi:hypothetical protein